MSSCERVHRAWQRWIVAWLCLALAVLPLAGCKTAPRAEPEPATVHIAAVVIDEQRLVPRADTADIRVWRRGAWLPARAGMTLERGDRVATGRNITAVIRWPGLGDAYLRPHTSATIGSLDDVVGDVFIKVRGFFAAQTRLVGALAKGTSFLVRGMPDGSLELTVFEGAVEMSPRAGAAAWLPVLMRAGETAVGAARAPLPAPASEAALQSTRDWVERVERVTARPPTRTSSAGTAAAVGIAAVIGAILLGRAAQRDRQTPSTGASGTGSGQDRPTTTPTPTGPAAPTGLAPGTTDPSRPQRLPCDGTTLRWQPVPGVTGYAVTVEQGIGSPPSWRTVAQPRTPGTSVAFSPNDMSWNFRFSVRAQTPAIGPVGGPVYFYFACPVIR
jgi:hypothetical protein